MFLGLINLTPPSLQAYANTQRWFYQVQTTEAIVTAYDAQDFPGEVAAGHKGIVGTSIACPRSIRLGSMVAIDNKKFSCDDRTAVKYDGRFDLFVATRAEALRFGKKEMTVTIFFKR